jgi:hypothetical protein
MEPKDFFEMGSSVGREKILYQKITQDPSHLGPNFPAQPQRATQEARRAPAVGSAAEGKLYQLVSVPPDPQVADAAKA